MLLVGSLNDRRSQSHLCACLPRCAWSVLWCFNLLSFSDLRPDFIFSLRPLFPRAVVQVADLRPVTELVLKDLSAAHGNRSISGKHSLQFAIVINLNCSSISRSSRCLFVYFSQAYKSSSLQTHLHSGFLNIVSLPAKALVLQGVATLFLLSTTSGWLVF